jgi:hypothetical protein
LERRKEIVSSVPTEEVCDGGLGSWLGRWLQREGMVTRVLLGAAIPPSTLSSSLGMGMTHICRQGDNTGHHECLTREEQLLRDSVIRMKEVSRRIKGRMGLVRVNQGKIRIMWVKGRIRLVRQ